MPSRTSVASSGAASARTRKDTVVISTGPPKYTLSSSCARPLRSGNRLDTVMLVGLLTMTPAGAGAILFITSTTESLKLGSSISGCATRRTAVSGFALSADAGHDIANRRRDAQRARIMVRKGDRRGAYIGRNDNAMPPRVGSYSAEL